MTVTHCMMTGEEFKDNQLDAKDRIVVVQGGRVIGSIKPEAVENVKTLRITFSRPTANAYFAPVQANGIEFFFELVDKYDEPY